VNPDTITASSLDRISDEVGELRGWDFSRMRDSRDPVPWDYPDVARRYLRPTDRVLDVGTGGGERFLQLAASFGEGVGIDAFEPMVRTARENTPAALAGKVRFELMRDDALTFADESFDVVLCRHAGARPGPVARVLRPGGYYVTQGVGERNTQSVFDAFGWGSNGGMWRREAAERGEPYLDPAGQVAAFEAAGCRVVARGEYDVGYYFEDLASLVFWLKAVPLPEEFDPARHWEGVRRLVRDNLTARGVRTNEHRELLVVRKG
jgi:SAM-dependent methyltransferase